MATDVMHQPEDEFWKQKLMAFLHDPPHKAIVGFGPQHEEIAWKFCLAAGMNAAQIAAISNLAGGIVCEIPVVVPIDKEQLLTESLKLYTEV